MKRGVGLILALVLMLTMLIGTVPTMAAAKKAKTAITLSHKGTITLNVGDTLQLKATTKPAGKTVKWSTGKKSVATVKNGLVTAKGEGTTTITAKVGKKTAKGKVKVKDPYKPTSVSLKQGKKLTIKTGEALNLSAVLKPNKARTKLTWTSSKPRIVTVDKNGKIKGPKTARPPSPSPRATK